MTTTVLLPAISAIAHSFSFNNLRVEEDALTAGEHTGTTLASLQSVEGFLAFSIIDQASKLAGRPLDDSLKRKNFIFLSPYLLSVIINQDFVGEKIKSVARLLQKNLGGLYQLATLISCLYMLVYSQSLLIIPSLCVLTIGYLDSHHYFSIETKNTLRKCDSISNVANALLNHGWISRIVAGYYLYSWGLKKFLPISTPSNTTPPTASQLTYEQITKCSSFREKSKLLSRLEMNEEFIYWSPNLPEAPEIDLEVLVKNLEGINWENHLETLKTKLNDCAKFRQSHDLSKELPNETYIDFAKESLESYLDQVKTRSIKYGPPIDYCMLEYYLKMIAHHLSSFQENDQVDILFRLAVEAGSDYCGSAKFQVPEEIFSQYLTRLLNIKLSLRDKVLFLFRDMRETFLQSYYAKKHDDSWRGRTFRVLNSHTDRHSYNTFLVIFGNNLGLHKKSLENDHEAQSDFSHSLTQLYWSRSMKNRFWKENSVEKHLETLFSSVGTPSFPKTLVYQYWSEWIDKTSLSEEEKEDFKSGLMEGYLKDFRLETGTKIHKDVIKLMLFDMGIFQVSS